MTAAQVSAIWRAIAPAMGNHLWQSTLFAVAAGLLTLLMRKHRARVRYWIWLAASLKFLIPFSLLIELGNRLRWWPASAGVKTGLYFAMEEIGQPFLQSTAPIPFRAAPSV